jgi:hypothetical protein
MARIPCYYCLRLQADPDYLPTQSLVGPVPVCPTHAQAFWDGVRSALDQPNLWLGPSPSTGPSGTVGLLARPDPDWSEEPGGDPFED